MVDAKKGPKGPKKKVAAPMAPFSYQSIKVILLQGENGDVVTYKEHLEQLEVINDRVEVYEMMGHSKAKILRSFRDFEQSIMREQRN